MANGLTLVERVDVSRETVLQVLKLRCVSTFSMPYPGALFE